MLFAAKSGPRACTCLCFPRFLGAGSSQKYEVYTKSRLARTALVVAASSSTAQIGWTSHKRRPKTRMMSLGVCMRAQVGGAWVKRMYKMGNSDNGIALVNRSR